MTPEATPALRGSTAAIAVALHEAAAPDFRRYAHAVVDNAQALAGALAERGFDLVSGGTDNHLILIDLTSKGIGGKPAAQALDQAGIELNYNAVPFDPRKPFDPSGIRLGTAAITTRGLGMAQMPQLAAWIDETIKAARDADNPTIARIAAEVTELTASYPMPGWA
jgi:glycine hydroxymethyltransferase